MTMTPFPLLLKPVGGSCNLNCGYCFYKRHSGGVIDRRVLERTLETYTALPFGEKCVTLQGGEPLLAPDWVFDMIDAAPLKVRAVQTNGTLVTRDMARRFARRDWLVGVSLDGPPQLNSARVDTNGNASFEAAVRGIRHLEAEGAQYNILAVVSKANVRNPVETYRFLRDNFLTRFHQYIECTGPGPASAITGEEWGGFLCGLFDEWVKRDTHEISIRLFDSIMSQLLGRPPTNCTASTHCRHYLVVEHDGSVYPCDFHVRPDLRLGNVMTDTWEAMSECKTRREFADAKCFGLPAKCGACEFRDFCNGDCPRSRNAGSVPVLCEGWRRFYSHALPVFGDLLFRGESPH